MQTWAFVSDVPISREQYDRLDNELGADKPEGLIVHAAGESGSGVRIIDVWESKQQFELFRSERLTPAMRAVGYRAAHRQGQRPRSHAGDVSAHPPQIGERTRGDEWLVSPVGATPRPYLPATQSG